MTPVMGGCVFVGFGLFEMLMDI